MARQVRVGRQGRIDIPADWREALQIETCDTLFGSVEDGSLIFETREAILDSVLELFHDARRKPSVLDELIQERHEKAHREVSE